MQHFEKTSNGKIIGEFKLSDENLHHKNKPISFPKKTIIQLWLGTI